MNKRALITGISGQDGSYLAEFLLEKGYDVFGLVRNFHTSGVERILSLAGEVHFLQGDLTDQSSLMLAIQKSKPHEVYNLAAQSIVQISWDQPVMTGDVTGLGVTRLLEAIRLTDPSIRFYQASSSEMFGKVRETPQNELTPFHPRSPYAVAKIYAYHTTVNYRESYGMYCVSGILFNHESPRRGIEFVTRKITDGVARIKLGLASELRLGNTSARRDWGFAGDYVKAMWLMLQQDKPEDFVIATGQSHSVQEFSEAAFRHVGLDPEKYILHDSHLLRLADVENIVGDPTKAREKLGWQPEVSFEELVKMMVDADLEWLSKK